MSSCSSILSPVRIGYLECHSTARTAAIKLPNPETVRFFKKPADLKSVDIMTMFCESLNRFGNVCQYGAFVDDFRRRPCRETSGYHGTPGGGKGNSLAVPERISGTCEQGGPLDQSLRQLHPAQDADEAANKTHRTARGGGTGKLSLLEQLLPSEEGFYKSNASQSFWDGYHPIKHKSIICEEISSKSMKFNTLKEITGSTVTTVDVKNQPSVPMLTDRLFVSTNNSFQKIYKLKSDE